MQTIIDHRRPRIKTPPHTRGHCTKCGLGMIGATCGRCRERRRELIGRIAELIDCRLDELMDALRSEIGGGQ
jgi:hypothetical protein